MKSIVLCVFAACILSVSAATGSGQVLLNEIVVDPPGTDAPCEYIELSGPPNASLANLYILDVDGDTDGNPGLTNFVVAFGNPAPTLGSNGLFVLVGTNQCGSRTYPAGTVVASVQQLNSEVFPNGTNTFLLVSSPTVINPGQDYDTDNNGTLELPAGATIVDSIAWTDGGASDITYGPRLTANGGTIGAATRFLGNTTANSAAAWYGGALTGANNASVTYSATIRTANFPSNGVLTPGDINVGTAPTSQKTPFDFDGDHKTDIGIFRPTSGEWWVLHSLDSSVFAAQFGSATDKPMPADFTGDGKADIAFFRPSGGTWFVLRSEDFSFYGFPFGISTDTPAPADYDGDGKADPAVFRAGDWYILRSSDGTTASAQFGVAGDKPVPTDYDGDGKADLAIYRPNGATGGEWWIQRTTAGLFAASFGSSTDKPVVGDWTGDGKADCAFFRPSPDSTWYILRSEDQSFYGFPFGSAGDIPAPGDYDGDGKTDAAVFRQPGAQWFVNKSSGGVTSLSFGTAGDQPIPSSFVR
jgi:hypothetical protein